ncbi:MAG TPA: hypothetical protein VI864_04765 [Candidatus Bathyarchaeia archaeon]|nr:hypothetical protein [Candidatus Bathyarchaeia archaeon]
MDIETVIISILTSSTVSGIIGYFIQNFLSQKRETELRIQRDNRGHYESWMVFMRIVMKPDRISHFKTSDPTIPTLTEIGDIRDFAKERLNEFYYSALLFSPDYVLSAMKEFIKNPTEENFMKCAIVMRKDLWKKKTKADLRTLSLE